MVIKPEEIRSAVTHSTFHEKQLFGRFISYANVLFISCFTKHEMFWWLHFPEVPWLLAVSRLQVVLRTTLEVTQQHGEHVTRTPRH